MSANMTHPPIQLRRKPTLHCKRSSTPESLYHARNVCSGPKSDKIWAHYVPLVMSAVIGAGVVRLRPWPCLVSYDSSAADEEN
jgi:hypothetical protein